MAHVQEHNQFHNKEISPPLHGAPKLLPKKRGTETMTTNKIQTQRKEQKAGIWTTLSIAWDAWRTTRGGPKALAARQQARLADLVAFARQRSPYYRDLYRDLPECITDIRCLPPVTKPELMAHFDDWVTDPDVTRASAETFAADPRQIGEFYLGRYLLCSTSGTTGTPALFVHDQKAMKVYETTLSIRGYQAWYSLREIFALLRAGVGRRWCSP